MPLGDRQARLELEKPDPDYEVARAGLLQGRTHPDDIPGVMKLYRRFRHVGHIDKVIRTWARGDGYIEQLTQVAAELHAKIASGESDPATLAPLIQRVRAINEDLTPLEDAFSATLGKQPAPPSSFSWLRPLRLPPHPDAARHLLFSRACSSTGKHSRRRSS